MTWNPDYTTLAAVKSYLRITDTADDVFITAWITAVSRNVDDHTGRQFGQVATPEVREYAGVWDRFEGRYIYEIDDLQDLTGLAILNEDGDAVTDYTLRDLNAGMVGKPYTQLWTTSTSGQLAIEGRWGWSAVPASIAPAVWMQAARLAARRDSPFGIAGSPSEGSEIRLLAALDPDFKVILKPYVRKWWVG